MVVPYGGSMEHQWNTVYVQDAFLEGENHTTLFSWQQVRLTPGRSTLVTSLLVTSREYAIVNQL